MKMNIPDRQLSAAFNLSAQICSWLAGGIAVLALIGWITGSLIVAEIDPNGIPMAPTTIIALILTCAGLAVRARWPGSRLPRAATSIAAVLASCLAGVLLAESFGSFERNLEELLTHSTAMVQGFPIGRMSPFSAIAFLLTNLALLAISLGSKVRRTARSIAGGAALVVVAGSFVMLLGYAFGTPLLYGGTIIPVALPTAAAFLLVGLGIIAVIGPSAWPLRVFVGSSVRTRMLRILLPTVLVSVIGEGLMGEVLQHALNMNVALALSLQVMVSLGVIGSVITLIARSLGGAIDAAATAEKQAREALRESDERLKEAQALGRIGSWEFDVVDQKITWSEQTFLLYERDPSKGSPSAEEEGRYYTPEQNMKLREYARLAIEGGREYFYELEAKLPSGKHLFLAATMRPKKDARGQVVRLFGTVQDITERKRAEEALRASEELFRTLADTTSTGIFIYQGERLVYSNRATSNLSGYTAEEFLALRFWDLMHPAYRELVHDRGLARQRGEPVSDRYEVKIVRKNGEERWIDYTAGKIDWKGHPAVLGSAFDITERKQAEEELVKAKEFGETILNSIHDSISIIDVRDFRIVGANKAFLQANVVKREEVIGRFCYELTRGFSKPCAGPDEICPIQAMLSSRKPSTVEHVHNAPNGSSRNVEITAYPLLDSQGEVVQAVHIARDITERKRAEEALRTSEALFREVYENMKSGSAIFTVLNDGGKGSDYIVKKINRAGLKMEGKALEEVVGKRFIDIRPTIDSYGLIPVMKKVWETGKSAVLPNKIYIDERYSNYYENYIFRLPSDEVVTLYNDVTESKRSEEALRESERRLKEAQEIGRIGSWEFDVESQKIIWSDQTYKIYDRDPALGPPSAEEEGLYYAPEQRRRLREYARLAIEEGRESFYELELKLASGKHVFCETAMRPERDAQGRVAKLFGTVQDITERKQAEEKQRNLERQVQHSQKLESLGVLAGGIAHDFNNLLMVILGNTDIALQRLSPESPARPHLEAIEKASHRAASLTNQMLAYSGRGAFQVRKVDLSETVKEIGHLLEASISKKVRMEMILAHGLPPVEVDVAQMQQVVMNLIINASEAVGGDTVGEVVVETGVMECNDEYLRHSRLPEKCPPGKYVFLRVKDNGSGMEDETRASLFDPFYSTKFTGRGLGLAAVLGIVRGHRGAIMVESEAGKGSTFTILIPALEGELEKAESGEEPEKEAARKVMGTILVAEDEEAVSFIVSQMLMQIGFSVLTAADGQEAVEVFKAHADEIGVVLLDLTMPRLSGEEVFDEIRKIRGDIRVVLSSGFTEKEVKERFRGKRVAGYLQKPYQYASLLAVLRRNLKR